MAALIVGGDYIEPLRADLAALGVAPVLHWSGRKAASPRRSIPADTELVVLLIDRVNHMLAQEVRSQARRRGLPLVFSRRSTVALREAVAGFAAARAAAA